jgi:hypothetical protein
MASKPNWISQVFTTTYSASIGAARGTIRFSADYRGFFNQMPRR